jgi:carbon-monoxide dehydrogenase medium subunit
VSDARLVLSAALDRPTRLIEAEAALKDTFPTESSIAQVGEVATAEAALDSDNRGSADYKSHLLRVHLARTIRSLTAE